MSNSVNSDEIRKYEYFTPLHHQIAEQLGYKQTPNYASWYKVEQTAPVQAIDRLVTFIDQHYILRTDSEAQIREAYKKGYVEAGMIALDKWRIGSNIKKESDLATQMFNDMGIDVVDVTPNNKEDK